MATGRINRLIGFLTQQKDGENKAASDHSADAINVEPLSTSGSKASFFYKTKLRTREFFENNKTYLKLLLVAIPVIAVFFFVRETQKNQSVKTKAGSASLILSTNSTTPKVGETFVVAVSLDTGGLNITAADVRIRYRADLVQAQEIKSGGFLPIVLSPSQQGADFGTIDMLDQAEARAWIAVGADPTGSPVTGTGNLATITFKAVKAGTVTIHFGDSTAVAASGQTGDVSGGNRNSINITIADSGIIVPESPTPTPAPTKSPTPKPNPISSPTANCIPVGGACSGNTDTRCCAPAVCRNPHGGFSCRILPND